MTTRLRTILSSLCGLALTIFLTSLPLLAAEAENEDPAETTAGLVFRWLNFLFIFGGAAWLIRKHGGAFFRARAQEIARSIMEASAAKAEAERQLREAEAKVARLDQEVAELRAAARRDSDAEAGRIRTSGLAEIEKIQVVARVELEAATRAAKHQLREMAAQLAIERAATLVGQKMNLQVREKMFRSFVSELGRNVN